MVFGKYYVRDLSECCCRGAVLGGRWGGGTVVVVVVMLVLSVWLYNTGVFFCCRVFVLFWACARFAYRCLSLPIVHQAGPETKHGGGVGRAGGGAGGRGGHARSLTDNVCTRSA